MTTVAEVRVMSACAVLFCPFTIGQTILNAGCSFGLPFIFYWLIFEHLIGTPLVWSSAPVLGSLIAAPFGCSVIGLAFAPIGMPEAVEHRLYGVWEPQSWLATGNGRWLLWILPFFSQRRRCWRIAALRHLCLGFVTGALSIPAGAWFAHSVLGPTMSADTFIYFAPAYFATLAAVQFPLGLLAYALPTNLVRVKARMVTTAGEPNAIKRLVKRALASPFC